MRKRGQHCVGLYQNFTVKQFLEETEELFRHGKLGRYCEIMS